MGSRSTPFAETVAPLAMVSPPSPTTGLARFSVPPLATMTPLSAIAPPAHP
ncbi:MAG: hypothetical protein JSR21_12750 [Proteobacteria bacterium]|nr:hypothetical protein [Pseudomonadota bacterium]